MIISIDGWQRSGKNILGTVMCRDKWWNDLSPREIEIEVGVGNTTLLGMPFPYEKKKSREVLDEVFRAFNEGLENRLFFIDEAHRILNARLWKDWSKEDTFSLAGIFQDDKLNNVIIYSYHPGKPDEELLGVDKMIRGATYNKFSILTDEDMIIREDMLVYEQEMWIMRKKIVTYGVLEKVSRYFSLFNTKEPVI